MLDKWKNREGKLLNNIIEKFDIKVTFVDLPDLKSWESSVQENTKLFLLETPSNPLGEVVDIKKLAAISKMNNIILAVDNCIMSPAIQKPLSLGADLVIHSATKYIDATGRCLAGAVAGNGSIIDDISLFSRSTGPTNRTTLLELVADFPGIPEGFDLHG